MAIIKCTECGHSVSTNAPTCPECGVPIENNLLLCTSCQNQVLKTDLKCIYCGQNLQEKTTHNAQPTQNGKQHNQNNLPKKNKKVIIFIIIFLLLASAGATLLYYYQKQQALKEEYSTYILLDGCTSIDAYEDFIQRYPNSQYIKDVQQRLSNIKKERLEWNSIATNGNKIDYQNFMSKHPASPYVNYCQNKIDSLDWLQAERINTEEAYNTYLTEHANGAYTQEASFMLEESKKRAVSSGEITMIKGICNNFFTSLSAKDEEGIKMTVNTVLSNFMNKSQATVADVINYMHQLYSDKEIQGMHFTINDDFLVKKEIPSDSTASAYQATFTVDQLINTSDLRKDAIVTYQVVARIASNAKLDRFDMQRK